MSPWVRLDENAIDHPKFLALSDGAWRLWCEGQSYCQKHLTDGLINAAALRRFRYFSTSRLKNLTATLVTGKGPLWHRLENGDIQVHDYLDWNDSSAEVLKARSDSRERKRRYSDRNASGNASLDASRTSNASSGVVCSSGFGSSEKREEKINGRATVMSGKLPKNHLSHAWCGRVCVPEFLHNQFVQAIGKSDEVLYAFYAEVFSKIPDDEPVEPDAVKFWRPLVAQKWPPKKQSGDGITAESLAAGIRAARERGDFNARH